MEPKTFKLENDKYFEEYFRKLLEKMDDVSNTLQKIGFSSGNESENKDENGFETFESDKEALKEYFNPNGTSNKDWNENKIFDHEVNKTVEEKKKQLKDWGKWTGDNISEILAANTPKISYKEIIRRFSQSVLTTSTVSSRMKINRRYDIQNPGYRRQYTTKILFAVDVSGSMSDEDLKEGMAVINSIVKHAEIIWCMFDTEIKKVEKNYRKAKKSFKIVGRGGTDFQPVIDYAKNEKVDGTVIFSDGYAAAPTKPKCKILWLGTHEETKFPVDWGYKACLKRHEMHA